MISPTTATHAVRVCVRAALQHEQGLELEGPTLDPLLDPHDLLAAVYRQRVVEVLVDHVDGLGLPQSVVRPLTQMRDQTRMKTLLQARELVRVGALLNEAGIRFLVFKGPALALQTTGKFTARGSGDIDIWVSPADVGQARRVLQGAGWRPPSGYPEPEDSWAWRYLLRTDYETPLYGEHSTIDLHWHLHPVRGRLPRFDAAWTRRSLVTIADVGVPTLSLPHALAHSCAHAAKDDWRWLRSLVDIHRLARKPESWRDPDAGRPLSSMMRASLSVTSAQIGLAPTTPAWVLDELRRAPTRLARRAALSQESPAPTAHGFPVARAVGGILRSSRGSAGPADVLRLLRNALLPGGSMGELHERSAVTALPKALLLRGNQVFTRLRDWRESRG